MFEVGKYYRYINDFNKDHILLVTKVTPSRALGIWVKSQYFDDEDFIGSRGELSAAYFGKVYTEDTAYKNKVEFDKDLKELLE